MTAEEVDAQYAAERADLCDPYKQSLAGSGDILQERIDAVEKAFEAECKALTGKDLVGLSELTNNALRLAWPFVLHELRKQKP